MAKSLEQKMAALSPARRKKVEARTAELIEDEKSLCDLRRALALTQEKMAEELGIGQDFAFFSAAAAGHALIPYLGRLAP